jgi:hypothetical protein
MTQSYEDTLVMYYTTTVSFIMAVIAIGFLINSIKKTHFRWVQVIFFISVVQDLSTSALMIGVWMESDPVYRDSHAQLVALLVSISLFFFYFTNNLIYWLYGFKYWVMSIEVPGGYKKNKGFLSERAYNLISWFGILLNFALILVVSYQRYFLSMSFSNGTYTT